MSENTSDKSPHNAPWVNEKVGGWKTKSTRIAYENPWIRLEEHDILNPAGKEGIYGKVHFKNRAMAIIPIDLDGNTWLVGQYRYALDEYFFCGLAVQNKYQLPSSCLYKVGS